MLIAEKVVESYIRKGLDDILADDLLATSLFDSLGTNERASALEWLRQNRNVLEVISGFPRKAPVAPIVIVVPGGDKESGEFIGSSMEMFDEGDTNVDYRGMEFTTTFRALCIAPSADVVTYLTAMVRFSLMRYRLQLEVAGLYEQYLTTSDLAPAEEFSTPETIYFGRGVVLTGKHLDVFPKVEPIIANTVEVVQTTTSILSVPPPAPPAPLDPGGPVVSTTQYIVPVVEDFTRANSTNGLASADSDQPWTVMAGIWGIDTNRGYMVSGTNGVAVIDAGGPNVTASVTLAVFAASARLHFRQSAATSGLYIEATATAISLWRNNAGVLTQLGTVVATPGAGSVLKVVTSEASVRAFHNGTQVLAVTETFNQTATKHGLGANSTAVRFDGFRGLVDVALGLGNT